MSNHIQVELDALNHAHTIAVAAKLGPEWVVYGLNMMWAYCFRAKVEYVTTAQLMGFFGSDTVITPLIAFGFLEEDGDEFRVKGTGRYTTLSEKRSEAGRAGRAKQLASRANGGDAGQARAKAQQVTSKSPAKAQQVPSKSRARHEEPEFCPPVAEQKRALDPRSLSLTGKRDLGEHEPQRRKTATGSALKGPAGAVRDPGPSPDWDDGVEYAPLPPPPPRPPPVEVMEIPVTTDAPPGFAPVDMSKPEPTVEELMAKLEAVRARERDKQRAKAEALA